MTKFWEEFFKLIKELFPAITAFFIGKEVGNLEKQRLEARRDALLLELERIKSKEKTRLHYLIKSDDDILDEALESGREMLERDRNETDG